MNKYLRLFISIWGTLNPDMLQGWPKESSEVIGSDKWHRQYMKSHGMRTKLVARYAFAVPSPESIKALTEFSDGRICEVGSGTGYWAKLLSEAGADVQAIDDRSSHFKNHRYDTHFKSVEGSAEKIEHDRMLFLCWPPMEPLASNCLDWYLGKRLAYIGEGYGGCTADDDFHDRVVERWKEVAEIDLPQWPGVHDRLYLYERKDATS